jgi:hypothetical protein
LNVGSVRASTEDGAESAEVLVNTVVLLILMQGRAADLLKITGSAGGIRRGKELVRNRNVRKPGPTRLWNTRDIADTIGRAARERITRGRVDDGTLKKLSELELIRQPS